MIISMSEGYHKFECGLPDIYGTILDKVKALSQGKMNPGDTKDYSRLALRVKINFKNNLKIFHNINQTIMRQFIDLILHVFFSKNKVYKNIRLRTKKFLGIKRERFFKISKNSLNYSFLAKKYEHFWASFAKS